MSRIATAKDASGKITVSLFREDATNPQRHFTNFPVRVDTDMVAISGGGRGDDTIGALLTASYPSGDLTTWFVSSKDHIDADPHYLVGFAIGMKIEGMSRDELYNSIRVFPQDSATAAHLEATASIPDNFILLGGGFQVFWRGAGSLATASFPTSNRQGWIARSKDHEQSDPSYLTSYAIGIQQQLLVGAVFLDVEHTDSAVVAHPRSTASLPSGFVLTGGGAEVHWTGAGNLLWNLEPSVGSFTAASKDHDIPDPSYITTYALGIHLRYVSTRTKYTITHDIRLIFHMARKLVTERS